MAKATSTYAIEKQEFLNSVVNKIGKQIYSDTAYVNPLKRLKKGFIENASDIEEIYIARAIGEDFDPDGKNTLDRVLSDVRTQYHQSNWQRAYRKTIHDKEVRKGFLTKEGVNKLANHLIESLHTGVEYEEYEQTLNILDEICTGAKYKKEVSDVKDSATAKEFIKEVKKTVNKMGRRSDTFATVENHSKPSQLVLFINEDIDVEIDVELLASAFNMSKTQLDDTVKIKIPTLSTNPNVIGILIDERALQIYDLFYELEPQRNAQGKFTTHHLTIEKMFSYSDLVNIAVFTKKVS